MYMYCIVWFLSACAYLENNKKYAPKSMSIQSPCNPPRGEETIPLSDYLQISFSPAHRHHLFIVAPREVIVMDLELKQAVGCISVERNASPLLRLLPCRQRDLLYCLHENGCVSVRVQQRVKLPTGLPNSPIDFPVREVSGCG